MTNVIIPPEENCADHRLEVAATSTAQADGCDTNSAIAQLSLHGQPLQGCVISFTLTGDALFTGGTQQFSAITDGQGEATVFFTDTRPETVLITCNFNQTQCWESASFESNPLADIGISGAVLQNNAQADGMSRNGMRYRVFQVVGGAPVPGAALALSVSGEAMLIPPVGPWFTDDNGLYDLYVTNGAAGQVLVSARIPSAPGAENNTFLNFVPIQVPEYVLSYRVTRNNAPADDAERNAITYNLSLNGVGVANRVLNFMANPASSRIFVFNPNTNAAGNNSITIASITPGPVVITASVPSIPSLLPVQVTLNFTEVMRRYSIVHQVIRDRSPAGGIPNQVRYTVLSLADGSPQAGVRLRFFASGEGRPSPTTGTTLMDGTFTLDIFRNFVGTVTVTARVEFEPLAESNVDVTFT